MAQTPLADAVRQIGNDPQCGVHSVSVPGSTRMARDILRSGGAIARPDHEERT